jgi:trans-feruloyl-CoA hydratase/vanillin synthase
MILCIIKFNDEWMSEFDHIELEVDDGIVTITLDRTEKKNALNPGLLQEAREAISIVQDKRLDVLIITGNGDSFCAGMDLEEYFLKPRGEGAKEFMEVAGPGREFFKNLKNLSQPTLAKVNGWALGGGYQLQGICDFSIASEEAKFGLPEINFDIFPSGGAMWTAVNTMNRRKAMYYSATGEIFSADEAERIGAITKTVPSDRLDEEVQDLSEDLCKFDRTALWFNKQVLEKVQHMDYEEAFDYEIAKLEQMNYLQGSGWLNEALPKFEDREYRPGVEHYNEQ